MSRFGDLATVDPDAEAEPSTGGDAPAVDVTRDGATFVLDERSDLEARWGHGHEVLWARGESLMIVAPPGAGKTTIAVQLVEALIGITDRVLGRSVSPADRVLYLAMDRPRQIRRAMRRRFGPEHREVLAVRLAVRPGPLPMDLAKDPDQLAALARRHGCDVIVVDSLKDAAVKLTDDEVGGNVNRAIQLCNAADIDVVVLHHQRKGDGTAKPTSLADVYGSTWLTAGAGSVLLLWGEAGAELVEVTHLKPPADPVGPLTVEHDHVTGVSQVTRGFDPLAYLRLRGAEGATVADAAQAEHGAPQKSGSARWKRTERRLRRLVVDGLARHETGGRDESGQVEPGRYHAAEPAAAVDTHRGHADFRGPWTGPVDTPSTSHGHPDRTPGQPVDATVDTPSTAPTVDTEGGVYIPPLRSGVSLDDPEALW